MKFWRGSAGVCLNEQSELLMVLQGKPEEKKLWTIPSGGKEEDETFEECCVRELEEETGYKVEIVDFSHVKKAVYTDFNISVEVHYFTVKIIGGSRCIQDPDDLIHEIAWKSADEIKNLNLSFPEDRNFLLNCHLKNSPLKQVNTPGMTDQLL